MLLMRLYIALQLPAVAQLLVTSLGNHSAAAESANDCECDGNALTRNGFG